MQLAPWLATPLAYSMEKSLSALSAEQRLLALAHFVAKKKFVVEGFYPGATHEADRIHYEAKVNELANRLAKLPPSEQTKPAVLNLFKPTMAEFDAADSEERDRFLQYLEELMDIFGIQSSDGLLNKWRYGFDPKEPIEVSNANALAAMTVEETALLARFKDITAATALDVLLAVLGPPTADGGGMRLWYLKPDATSTIGLAAQSGATVFIWMAKDRFTYSRRL